MIRYAPRILFATMVLLSFSVLSVRIQAQAPGKSSEPHALIDVDGDTPRVAKIMAEAEEHFTAGVVAVRVKKWLKARAQFDGAIDMVIDSGIDVRGTPALQAYYLALIERIHQIEIEVYSANSQSQAKFFGAQEYVPNARDKLAQSYLDQTEKNVTPDKNGDQQIATTGVDFKFTLDPLIQKFISYYTGSRGRPLMETGLQRSGQFMKMARKIFREEGVPEDITWLGQAGSAWQVRAFSLDGPSGLWQFQPATGVRWGLRQNAYVDERFSIEQATRAAAKYLRYLANRYKGNWELAIGAYGIGEISMDRAILRVGVADFWACYPFIVEETRNYVPSTLAIMLIAKAPEKYGFGHVKPMPPMAYDVVQVPTATSLELIADATNSSVETLRNLNPELRRETTPRGEAYNVRIPAGSAQQFVATLKKVPVDRREFANLVVIEVKPGENWPTIAARTGFSVAQLEELNRGLDLRVATRIVTPGPSRSRPTNSANSNFVKAVKGDTLNKIAARYGLDATELARMNGISRDLQLPVGREIRLR